MPSKPRYAPRDPLLLELMAALGSGRIHEDYIEAEEDPSILLHGLCEGGRVYVNPAPSTVDTVLHELLHRIRPEWTEAGVRRRITRLMRELTHDDIITIDALYQAVKRPRRRKGDS